MNEQYLFYPTLLSAAIIVFLRCLRWGIKSCKTILVQSEPPLIVIVLIKGFTCLEKNWVNCVLGT